MAQGTIGTLDATVDTGTTLASKLNTWRAALHSNHSGSSAPSYAVAGMTWLDTASAPIWVFKVYDGTDWISKYEINITANMITIVNHGSGDARTEVANIGQIQDGSFLILGNVSGTNTITADATPAITAYAAGQIFAFLAPNNTTGAVTLNVNGVGAIAIQKSRTALVSGDILQNDVIFVVYDGTQFQMISPPRVPVIADKAIPLSKLADGTDGQIITWDSNGEITAVGPGSSGQVLTSNGAGAAPSFQTLVSVPTTFDALYSHCMAEQIASVGTIGPGATKAGSQLRPCSAGANDDGSTTLSGTWRCLGYSIGSGSSGVTLWIRIS